MFNKLLRSEFLGNLSVQFSGTLFAQLLPFLASPILTRIYSENGFATLTIFLALTAVLIIPSGGRYYNAIVIAKDDEEANGLSLLSILITVFYSLFLTIPIVLFTPIFERFYSLGNLWFCIPAYIFLYGIYLILLQVSVRQKQFKRNATAKIFQSFFNVLFSIILGVAGWISGGLVVGKVLGVLASLSLLIQKAEWKASALSKVARKYIGYPKITILPALLDVFSAQALVFFTGKYYSGEVLGYLGLTIMVIIAPVALIGMSVRDVFYQKISQFILDKRFQEAKKLFLKTALFLGVFGLIISLIMTAFGEKAFVMVYGERWKESGMYASILGFVVFARLLGSPLSSLLNATHSLKTLSFWQLTYFITTVGTLYVLIVVFKLNISTVLGYYTIHELILYFLYFYLQYRELNKNQEKLCAESQE